MRTVEARRESAQPHPRREWFSGPVFVHSMNEASDAPGLEVVAVFFDAGARTKPHVRSTDQLLIFPRGRGSRRNPGGASSLPAGRDGVHPRERVALARRHADVEHVSPVDPAGGGPSAWAPEVPMHDWDAYMEGMGEGR